MSAAYIHLMKALLTHADQATAGLLRVTEPHLQAYADRHEYQLVVDNHADGLDGRPPQWAKVKLLRERLHEFDSVVWIDSDIVLRDQDHDLLSRVQLTDFQALCMEVGAGPAPNTGLWALRTSRRLTRS
jgi:alpha-N-acetylglucosamine transferase